MDKNIETYLRQLQAAMAFAGADPALVQDALFDAEEHLQSEVAAGGQFADVAQAYGSPEEVAAAYLGTVPVGEMAAAMAAPHPSIPVAAAVAQSAEPAEVTPVVEPATPPAPGETFVAAEATSGWIEVGGSPSGGQPATAAESGPVEEPASVFHPEPGMPVEVGKVFCPRCGADGQAGQAYCRRCGLSLPDAAGDTAVKPPRGAYAPPAGGPRPAGGQPPQGGQAPYGGQPFGAPPAGRYPVGVQTGMAAAEAARTPAPHSVWRDIFGPFVDPRTWTALVYMLLSLGLGTLYFTIIVTGFSMAVGMIVLIIGIPLLVLVLAIVRGLSLFEGRVVEVLLGVRMPRRLRPVPPNIGFFQRIWFWVSDGRTWLSVLYMWLMLPLGIVYFTVAVTLLSTSLALITSPFWAWVSNYDFVVDGVAYTGHVPGALLPLAFILGVLLLIGSMHAIRWIGRGHAIFAKAMLVRLK